MKVVKVTSKGQVTIPLKIRNELGIDDQSYLEVSTEGDVVCLRKRPRARPLGEDDPIWDLVGSAASGARDVSRDHDRYLAEAERRRWRGS
jgi:transcriptional pleiotropic regulator of transition state genes